MAAPVITSIAPLIGYVPGGKLITITGTGMDTVTAVTFAAVAGTIVSQTTTTVLVTTPAGSAGAVAVVATNPDGSDTEAAGFTYLDDWLGGSLESVENILCNCATFRTLMGVSTVATARDKVYWQTVRGNVPAPYTHLMLMDGGSVSERGNREYQHDDIVSAIIVWTEITTTGDGQKSIAQRNTNAMGKLLAEVQALLGTSPYLIRAVLSYDPPEPMPDDDSTYAGCWDSGLTFSWSI